MNEMAPQQAGSQPAGATLPADSTTVLSNAMRTIWRVLIERFWVLLAVSVVIFVAGVVGIMMITPTYTAQSVLKVDAASNPVTVVQNDSRVVQPDRAIIQSEVDVIRSREVAKIVAHDLNLLNDVEFDPAAGEPTNQSGGVEARYDAIASALLDNLDVTLNADSYIITIEATSTDAEKAARIANGFAAAYVKSNVSARTGTAGEQSVYLAKRRDEKEREAQVADNAVAQYKVRAGIVEGTANGTITDQQIGPLAVQLAGADAAAAEARAKVASARKQISTGDVEAVANVLNSQVVTALRTQRGQLIQTRDDIIARYGPIHPDTIRVTQQLKSLDAQILAEASRLTAAMESTAQEADAQARSLRSTLAKLRGEQAQNTSASVVADRLQRDATSKRAAFDELAKAQQQAEVGARNSLPNVQIVQTARTPEKPTKPKKLFLVAGAFLAGLMGGLAVITIQEVLARGIRSASDVERRLGMPMIGAIPALSKRTLRSTTPGQYLVDRPMTNYAEAFRSLRSALISYSGTGDRLPPVVVVTSSVPGEGKTSVALALARVMAMAGDRVIVIDGDLRRSGLALQTGYESDVTLKQVLEDGGDYRKAIWPDKVKGLDVIANNSAIFTAVDMFGGEPMRMLLDALKQNYDTVVIDTPPFLGVADARTLVAHADAVVLVAAWDSTPIEAVEKVVVQLMSEHAPVVGAVVTMVDPDAELMASSYYSKKYAAYYRD